MRLTYGIIYNVRTRRRHYNKFKKDNERKLKLMIHENIENNAKFFADLQKMKNQKEDYLFNALMSFIAEYAGKAFTAKEIEQKTGIPAAYIAANFGNKQRLYDNFLPYRIQRKGIEIIVKNKDKSKYVRLDENSQPDYQHIKELEEKVNTYTFIKRSYNL